MRLTLDGDWNATVTDDPLRITPRAARPGRFGLFLDGPGRDDGTAGERNRETPAAPRLGFLRAGLLKARSAGQQVEVSTSWTAPTDRPPPARGPRHFRSP